jgi:hypothetical protein
VVINTLESRLEKAIPTLRRNLAAFFEGERSDRGFDALVDHRLAVKP